MIAGAGRRSSARTPRRRAGSVNIFPTTDAITPVPTDLPSELMCMADAIAVGWSAAKRPGQPDEIPLVIGCGAIGLRLSRR